VLDTLEYLGAETPVWFEITVLAMLGLIMFYGWSFIKALTHDIELIMKSLDELRERVES
jgi:uncharacterized membrane protein YhdT